MNKTELDYINAHVFEPDGQLKGIGLVEINLDGSYYGREVFIYDSNGNPKVTIKVTAGDVITKYLDKMYSRNDNSNPFNPRHFADNPDYFRLIFDCIKADDKYYQVIVNNKTSETGFIRITDRSFKFETAEQYVNEWTTLGLDFDRDSNPLRNGPSDNAAIISGVSQKKYRIWRAEKIELKGDWLKVRIRDNEEGWIRWRQGDKIIVRLYFAC